MGARRPRAARPASAPTAAAAATAAAATTARRKSDASGALLRSVGAASERRAWRQQQPAPALGAAIEAWQAVASDTAPRVGGKRLPSTEALRRLPTSEKANSVLAGAEAAEDALPWIHSVLQDVRNRKHAEAVAKEEQTRANLSKVKVVAKTSGSLAAQLTRRRKQRLQRQQLEEAEAERKANELRRERQEAAKRRRAEEQRRNRGVFF